MHLDSLNFPQRSSCHPFHANISFVENVHGDFLIFETNSRYINRCNRQLDAFQALDYFQLVMVVAHKSLFPRQTEALTSDSGPNELDGHVYHLSNLDNLDI